MPSQTINKQITTATKTDIAKFVNERLGRDEVVENIFIGQKDNDAFEIMVITKFISPNFEKKLVELEYEVEEKYKVPSRFSTFSSASYAATSYLER